MRLLILSTPKTGSTWLRNLLACTYDLPQADLDYPFNPATASPKGPAWVSHHHFHPSPELLVWIEQSSARVITMIRHPADVLISLYHHLHEFKAQDLDQDFLRSMLHADFDRSPVLPEGPGQPFSWELECSVAWMETGRVALVRYEDLWRDPHHVLARLTSELSPVDADRIEAAIEQSSLEMLRSLAGSHGGFFRSGRVGEWRRLLGPGILRDLGTVAPYPALFDKLGYTLDPTDPLIDAPPRARVNANPFRDISSFDNGVPVPPIVVHAFLAQPATERRRWIPVDRTGPGSFFAWLNEPSPAGPCEPEWMLPLTNLAMYVYRQRADVASAFDLTGVGRPAFALWCLEYLEVEYGVASDFQAPILEAFIAWGNLPSPEDDPGASGHPLTNYAVFVYRTRPDLREAFPDVVRTHRLSFLHWIIAHGDSLLAPAVCLDAIRNLLIAASAGIGDGVGHAAGSPAPNAKPDLPPLAIVLYYSRPHLQAAFPDAFDTHELSLLDWVVSNGHALDANPDRLEEARRFLGGRLRQIAGGRASSL